MEYTRCADYIISGGSEFLPAKIRRILVLK